MNIEDKIEKIGKSFRGLWRSYELQWGMDDRVEDKWSVTFIYKDQCVETPLFEGAHGCLDFAIEKLNL